MATGDQWIKLFDDINHLCKDALFAYQSIAKFSLREKLSLKLDKADFEQNCNCKIFNFERNRKIFFRKIFLLIGSMYSTYMQVKHAFAYSTSVSAVTTLYH